MKIASYRQSERDKELERKVKEAAVDYFFRVAEESYNERQRCIVKWLDNSYPQHRMAYRLWMVGADLREIRTRTGCTKRDLNQIVKIYYANKQTILTICLL